MAGRAKSLGFNVMSYFAGTSSVEINIERIRGRVKKGGHDVPEEDQRRRYPRTLVNMEKLLPLLDLAIVFDNSTSEGHRLVAAGHPGNLYWFDPVPGWALRFKV